MAKVSHHIITAADIETFLSSNSDFAFEIRVLRELREAGITCRHGGTYTDPVTGKARQFDIQAETFSGEFANATRFKFAIECKNIRPNYPLVVHRIPRDVSEAFIELVMACRNAYNTIDLSSPKRLVAGSSPYAVGELVGKSMDQIGKVASGEIVGSDQDIFEKMGQALNSAAILLQEAHHAASAAMPLVHSAVIPVVVVPAQALWVVDYDAAGNIAQRPRQEPRASIFVGKEWRVGQIGTVQRRYSLSHLEICDIDHLERFIKEWLENARFKPIAL